MAFKVGVLEADQSASDSPVRKIKRAIADSLVEKSLARRISKFLIQMIKVKSYEVLETVRALWDGPLGVGNALPFSRQSDGGLLHYEIPHAGDVGIRRWGFRKRSSERNEKLKTRAPIRVSARPQSHLAAQILTRPQLTAPQRLADVLSLGTR